MKNSLKEKISAFSTSDLMKYRTEIFGIAAIWIVIFHVYNYVSLPLPDFPGRYIIFKIISFGNMGVDMFLFLSALGLYYSMSKNNISRFYNNRFKRVAVPYLILAVPFFVFLDFFALKDGIWNYLGNVTTVKYWLTGDHPTWYIAFIIIAYIFYPLIYKFNNKTKGVSTVFLICASVIIEFILFKTNNILYQNAERALSRIPIFLFGVLLSDLVLNKNIKIHFCAVIGAFVIAIGIFLFADRLHIILMRYAYGIMAICLIVLYSFLRTIFNFKLIAAALKWFGEISLEIYVVHVFLLRIIRVYDLWNILPAVVWYVLILIVAVTFAKLVSKLAKYMLNFKRKGRVKQV